MGRQSAINAVTGLLARLWRDASGNTLGMIAAALVPLLAMVGGGIDMGRSYLSQTRLQQACDAGVLAARKKLGSAVVTNGIVPPAVVDVGNRFFNVNFRDGAYGTANRDFQMTLESDYSISGQATVDVPTTIMNVFGYANVDVAVECSAKLNFSNTDIMFVLDTTGSMAWTNPGDSQPKIEVLRDVVKNFHAQLEGSKTPGTRIRYGFLPYSTNVNVAGLLKPSWLVDRWNYHGRVVHDTGTTTTGPIVSEQWNYVSGDESVGTAYVSTSCPAASLTWVEVNHWFDPDGTENWEYVVNGTSYSCDWLDSDNRRITPYNYTDYRYVYRYRNLGTKTIPVMDWQYQTMTNVDVRSLKNLGAGKMRVGDSIRFRDMGGTPNSPSDMTTYFRGCVEERDTYEIDDYDNVDFTRALDLDVDLVPTAGNPATQWRPMLNEASWVRAMDWGGYGSFETGPSNYRWDYLNAGWAGLSACPAAAQKLQEMDAGQINSYVDSLFAEGSTYHDIGMIWGTRMLSPTGLFATENADQDGKPTSRHMIFLTDGETAPLDLSYGTYGIEGIDRRRWSPASALSLTEVVEKRFTVACEEAKRRNITVWVIGFGVGLNPVMTDCAGPGHSYEAADAAELEDVFSKIAAHMGELRVTK
ncbi:MAG: pilus assembly protein TadG-related protein [Novosphingobium sp.]